MDDRLALDGDDVWLLPEHELQLQSLDALAHNKRYVVAQSMVQQSRFNLGLLILFILSIFVVNAFFIVVILMSKALRSSSKHILILSVAFGDLIQGLLILPLITDLGMKGSTVTECSTFHVARLFADFLIPSITTLGVLVLNIDYILRLTCNLYSEGGSRACILGSLFVGPWLVSILLLVPIYIVSLRKISPYNTGNMCQIITEGVYARTLLTMSYILYGCILLVVTLSVAVMYLIKREYLGLDVCGERVHAPFDICLASFVNILFYTPIFLFALLTTEGYLGCAADSECRTLEGVYTFALWLMLTKSWILPMAWIFGTDTRAGIRQAIPFC
ncbi:hypothetical protein C0Q70_19864 [Pomacea canaliculata]|uniref:G-protein coupled receptors family 1 profile domain-containing protein n=2 Tax=Pomacea canaliculata TaxID=400727 RepID=A0A2T7NDY1_POMCA|nr:hypothetical protein C0Q70_19864 [Pomacea canaliculata]